MSYDLKSPWANFSPTSPVHDKLMELAYKKAESQGYKNLILNAPLKTDNPNSVKRIDILGNSNGKVVGIECLTPLLRGDGKVSFSQISKVKKSYQQLVDQLIIVIPYLKNRALRSIKKNYTVWEFDLSKFEFGRLQIETVKIKRMSEKEKRKRRKEYNRRPEVILRRRKWQKEYRKKPEVKVKLAEYARKYYKKYMSNPINREKKRKRDRVRWRRESLARPGAENMT